ncbi:alcohol dehydrogenase [Natrinema gelatinilyticum]|uniref:alcohol dehydrogenase n=1 Tax=Natrinema gelatinilyticum TaxID=2961571 RepID=UPI0020C3F517|nr:alcohol dehydrogenase [Natrinema gelatinilyticum]
MSSETMRAVQVAEAGGPFEVVDRPIPELGRKEVRVKVEACGVCHSDSYTKEGSWPSIEYPRVPGHEIAGRIDVVGDDVDTWSEGQRVGVGWHGDHCFSCEPCRRGEFIDCEHEKVTGIDIDGGYAEYVTVLEHALARIPTSLNAVDAAPLLCAGVSTFNALRKSNAGPGDVAAVQGLGGLGHLGVQYAAAAGLETVAISRGTEKRDLAYEFGADHYIDSTVSDPAEELMRLGGAKVLLATAPSSEAIESIVPGLAVQGQLLTLGVPDDAIEVSILDLIENQRSLRGHSSGTARESQDTLEFSSLRDITPMIETFSLEEAAAAYERMMNNDAQFRAVLVP